MINQSMLAVASSVQGYSHKKRDIPNQDSFSYLINEQYQIFVAVVSDGAGSASNAKLGSSWCCQNITQDLMNIAISVLDGKISKSWYIEKLMLAIGNHINFLSNLSDDIRSFHHTMSAVIFSPMGGKIIQIGDSPVVVITDENVESYTLEKSVLFDEIKEGEYANETNFLTSPNWRDKMRLNDLPTNASAVFLMSDGAGAIFTPRKKFHTPAMLEVFRRFKEDNKPFDTVLNEFFDMDAIHARTGDDKTLVAYFPRQWVNQVSYSENYKPHNISEEIFLVSNKVSLSTDSDMEVIPVKASAENDSLQSVQLDKEAFDKNHINNLPHTQSYGSMGNFIYLKQMFVSKK